ncbi:MAG: polysaccharide deacetylase family protein [Bacteroidetes bacterium]|nr:polysaccharide deacetylase family protein [Bacteroidota bacterium]
MLDFCFVQRGFEYQVISDTTAWSKIRALRINYSHHAIPCDYLIKPHDLLFEEGVREDIQITAADTEIRIDGMTDELALIFRFLSRYEEYLPHERDAHDRYMSSNSELVKLNLHHQPVADQLNKKIWNKLGLDYTLVESGFECVPSFDIDVAWAYKHRKLGRSIGAGITNGKLRERLRVLAGKEKDPYDTYSYITEISAKVNRIICFALLGDWSKYNKNIHWKNEAYGSLIRGLNATGGMGIHPSYEAHLNAAKLQEEMERLEHIVGHEIVKSRQHFLRLRIPESYEILISKGIQRDFTMGYADNTGFRAGTSFPFYFFNLRSNEATPLLVFPFAYMDGVLKDQLKMSPSAAKEHVKDLIDSVKNVGGVFMCIWHNSSINDLGEWKGWKDVLDYTMSLVEKNDFSGFDEDFFD